MIPSLSMQIAKERLGAGRMVVIWILLGVLTIFTSWGFSDSRATFTSGYGLDSAYDILFASTAATIWGATLGALLISFDGVSRDRLSGVFEVKLSQPMSRQKFALSLIIGHWGAILVPFIVLNLLSVLIIWHRIDDLPSIQQFVMYIAASALLVLWWTIIQLLASSWASDMGLSIAMGMGVWISFNLLWIIPTAVIAAISGTGVDDLSSSEFTELQSLVDLFNPNGVYNNMMEMLLEGVKRSISPIYVTISSILWTLVPAWLFIRRIQRISP
ncbi:MAG: hypothetical protein CL996_08070 [Euryarchaeota archaeon]|nr:hypothetical protein [Euryarchaeota archaeon]